MDRVKRTYKYLLTLFTGMICGTALGVMVITSLISYRIDQYHEKINYLETVILEKNAKLEKLEESINKKKVILKDVEIVLHDNADKIDEITLEKHIKEKYTKLIGKEVKNIDTDIVFEVIDKRIMIIKDRQYKLRISRLVLTEVLKIWVEVEVIS
jgi:uncharacterized circularly permuted ATP-grasp superfamily protein